MPHGARSPVAYRLEGGGELGALIREKDWAATPLGPRDRWPQSLRTALGICLSSRHPMLLWWGPELCVLYNDAYVPIFGGKHPDVLGKPGIEAWGEIWEVIGPLLDAVIRRGESTWTDDGLLLMRRNGYAEETYFTWSYSPITREDGGVGGVFTAVTETTARVLSERRLDTLRALGEDLAGTKVVAQACAKVTEVLAKNPLDIPFALVYLLEGDEVRLASSAGIDPAHPASMPVASLSSAAGWPFAEVARTGRASQVEDAPDRFGPLPLGPWQEPTRRAMVLPIAKAGSERPFGFLVVGVSPSLAFDEAYRSFLELVAGHTASALANADAHEQEGRRAEALAAVDRAKTVFFSNVSHEFRTPLTLILGPIEAALASSARTLHGAELDAVHRNALRLLKLVNALLDFSRIEAGRAHASYEATDLARLTTDLASAFRSAIEGAGLTLVVDCPPLPTWIHVDRDMWEKIVLNLLSNAFKFTFEGAIHVRLRAEGDRVELTVSDTGTGIPAHELPRLFERFHRVEGTRARTHEGSGIGLALVRDLVRLHGGDVRVESSVGNGSTFVVTLPSGVAHLPAEHLRQRSPLPPTKTGAAAFVSEATRWLPGAAETAGDTSTPLPVPGGPEAARIIVADDNADMRDYVQRLLSERWTVEAFATGAAALASARVRRPDLVLTDVMMPDLDGFELLRALRADDGLRHVPVVLLSARAGEEARIEGLRAGADDYLVKPFSAKELVARVRALLSASRQRAAAEAERERLFGLFVQAPCAISVFEGRDHRIVMANPMFERMFSRKMPPGVPFAAVLPELTDQPWILERHDRIFRTGVGEVLTEQPILVERGDGVREERFFNAFTEPYRDADERVIGQMCVIFEVTAQVAARRHADEQRVHLAAAHAAAEEARREAEIANRAKDEFLAMLGHELRNPLAPIVTALHLMNLRGNPAEEKQRTVIGRQVAHLVRLVDDLLDVSRIARGQIDLKREPVELSHVIAKAAEMASPLLERRRHHLTVSVPETGLALQGDPDRLAQVFSNLLSNAAKYTEPGGWVAVHAEREGESVVVVVRDTGVGIAPEMLPRVFDLFTQERQALDRSQGGLGLGLAIVRSLVVAHGGSVSVHSDGPGRGTEVVVKLPALSPPEPAVALDDPRAARSSALPEHPTARILIVDDNDDLAEALADALTDAGFETRTARDALSALRVAKELLPAAAVLDIGLPDMDGYELARRLREDPAHRHLRLVALTGYGQPADRHRSRAAGFDALLVKPSSVEEIETKLKELLAAV